MARKKRSRRGGITLSPKHGVNPAIPRCYFCGKPKNQVILAGKLPKDAEAPQDAIWDSDPCDECLGYMKQGVILISVRVGEQGDNPYRTGGWVVVRDEAIRRMVQPEELSEKILKERVAFVPDDAWDALGLPRG